MRTISRAKLLMGIVCLLSAIAISTALVVAAHAEPGLQSDLTAISGQGSGHVHISPDAEDRPTFDAQVEVNVQGMLPNSTFLVQRRIDLKPDGVCTETTWLTVAVLTTSEGGAGAQHFVREAPLVSGTQFDVQVRVIGNGTELRSDCMTVTIK